MDPISIIVGSSIVGLLFLAGVLLAPKVREFNELVAREEAELQSHVRHRGWRIEKPEQSNIKWTITGPNWQIHYDTELSSESSNPHLLFIAETPKTAKSRFIVLTESGFKMMNHPLARKMAKRVAGMASKLVKVPPTSIKSHTSVPTSATLDEVFRIIDAKCNYPIGRTGTQPLILIADSGSTLQRVKTAQFTTLADKIFSQEKSHVHDNNERIAQFESRIEIKFYHARPTAEHLQNVANLGEYLLNQQF